MFFFKNKDLSFSEPGLVCPLHVIGTCRRVVDDII